MKPGTFLLAVCLGWSFSSLSFGEPFKPGQLPVLVPESAGSSPSDRGVRSHTHLRILVTKDVTSSSTAQFNTPATLRSVYKLPSTGGSYAIAIVDAYHYPSAQQDFNTFASQFSLPLETSSSATALNRTFQVVYATGLKPLSGGNFIASWNMEAALDIEWAHAMAPNAKIYLVEAASDSFNDLNYAVQVAAGLPGVKEISMSWGGGEMPSETFAYDLIFTKPGVVYLAAGGDTSDVTEYPSASPNVVSCGGTSLNRNSGGAFLNETAWKSTGCGLSAYESRPSYQNAIASVVGNRRGMNDIAFDADPNTGVYVYDSTPVWGQRGWWILGGTSLATPALAGVINMAASLGNGYATSTAAEQTRLYGNMHNANAFRDITAGNDGTLKAVPGWDFITGVGSPVGITGK